MKKKKIGIMLLMMILMLSIGQISSVFADPAPRELGAADITSADVYFYDGAKVLTETTKRYNVTVPKEFPGYAWTGFSIHFDLTDISANGAPNELKSGDILRVSLPSHVRISKSTFKTDKVIDDGIEIGTVAVDIAESQGVRTKNDIVVTFSEKVKDREKVKINLKFLVGVVVSQEDQNIEFDLLTEVKTLKIDAIKKPVDIGHILLKDTGNVVLTPDKKYGVFEYFLIVNRAADDLDDIIIKDVIKNDDPNSGLDWNHVIFDKNSFQIEEGDFNDKVINGLIQPQDHIYNTESGQLQRKKGNLDPSLANNMTLTFDNDDNPKAFNLKITKPGKKGFVIKYNVLVPADEAGKGYKIKNIASIVDSKTNTELLPKRENNEKNEKVKYISIIGSAEGQSTISGRIKIIKQDENKNPVAGVKFELTKKGTDKKISLTTSEFGEVVFKGLDLATYEIKEIETPAAYEPITTPINDVTLTDTHQFELVKVVNNRKTIDIKVEKIWAGEGAEEKEVTFTLKRKVKDSAEEAVEIMQGADKVVRILQADKDASNNFVTFENMLQYNDNNEEYEYYVNESQIDGYQSSGEAKVVQDSADMIWKAVITNTKEQKNPPVQPQQPPVKPDPEPSEPSESSDGNSGSGTISKVEKIVPKEKEQPKPQDPKPEQPKAEEPKSEQPKPEQPKTEEPKSEQPKVEEPQVPQPGTEVSTEKITVGGSAKEGNDTNVLPDSIPNVSSQKDSKNKTQVDPQSLKKLPKTGEGLNSVAYTAIFALLGMSLIGFGAYRKLKSAK